MHCIILFIHFFVTWRKKCIVIGTKTWKKCMTGKCLIFALWFLPNKSMSEASLKWIDAFLAEINLLDSIFLWKKSFISFQICTLLTKSQRRKFLFWIFYQNCSKFMISQCEKGLHLTAVILQFLHQWILPVKIPFLREKFHSCPKWYILQNILLLGLWMPFVFYINFR